MLAGYTAPEAERASSAGIPIPRLPRRVEVTTGNLKWKNSVKGQIYNIDVPITTQTLSIAAGAGSGTIALADTSIPNFSTRFGSTFYEYCIVGARIDIVLGSSANSQGGLIAYVDEKNGAVTQAKAQGSPHLIIPFTVTPNGQSRTIEWKAQDYDDLLWNAIGTSFTAAQISLIAGTFSGTAATTTGIFTINGALAVCFRGIRG